MTDLIFSASQVETYGYEAHEGCPYKWAQYKLARVPKVDDPSAVLGTRVHAIAEDWQIHAKLPDLAETLTLPDKYAGTYTYYPGQIFNAGLHLLPAPGQLRIEGDFEFSTSVLGSPIRWRGRKDMEGLYYEGQLVPPAYHSMYIGLPGVEPEVGDHKTTKDWRYQKTTEKLQTDGQCNLYSLEAMERFRVQRSRARWVTYHTRKHDARVSLHNPTIGQAQDVVAKLERSAHEMQELYQLHRKGQLVVSEVRKNPNHCSAFGGCKLAGTEHCKLSISDYWSNDTDNVTNVNKEGTDMLPGQGHDAFMSAISGMAQGLGALPPPPPVVQLVPPPPVQVAPAAPPPVAPPRYWQPGDPLNDTQKYLQGHGAKLSMIANAASLETGFLPPPAHVSASYDSGGQVEPVRVINAPEGPAYAPASPEQQTPVQTAQPAQPSQVPQITQPTPVYEPAVPVDDLDAMTDRKEIKAAGLAVGLDLGESREGLPKLRERVRQARRAHAVPPSLPPVHVQQPCVIVPVAAPAPQPVPTRVAVDVPPPGPLLTKHLAPWIALDLETTGLNSECCQILELFAAPVDPVTLQLVGQPLHVLVKHSNIEGQPYAIAMHGRNGLWDALTADQGPFVDGHAGLDDVLEPWLAQYGKGLCLLGDSVHFDLGFLREHLAASPRRLSHRVIDTSVFRATFEAWGLPAFTGSKGNHRAMADVQCSIQKLQHYRTVLSPLVGQVRAA